MATALILVGHGSQILPETAGVVWQYVDRLRAMGVADEITAAFWKEQPEFSQVLKTVAAEAVVIVPLFTAGGYYVNTVIPTEMGLKDVVTRHGMRTIYRTAPLGEHPTITNIVQQRVRTAITSAQLSPTETAVAIIGHGTARSQTTQLTTQTQAQAIRDLRLADQVVDAYLDDEPNIPSIFQRTDLPNLVVVPFFLAQGSHVAIDVPEALGIHYGDYPAEVGDRRVYYTPPIGTEDAVIDLILQLVKDTGLPTHHRDDSVWDHFPHVGHDLLLQHLEQAHEFILGQLHITANAVAPTNSTKQVVLYTPTELRAHIREHPYRMLASSADLPMDWVVPITRAQQIPAVVETVYPGVLADWAALQQGQLAVETFMTVIQRQQGIFMGLHGLDNATLTHFVSGVCGRCIKHPIWHDLDSSTDRVPCSSPCNLLLSSMKEKAR